MSKFYVEDPTKLYACYRCGEMMGEIRESEGVYGYICESCGEQGIVSFLNALDILNDMYVKGELHLNGEDQYIDDFTEDNG